MEYSKFSLGLRFAMTSDASLTPDDCWNIVFSEVPITHVVGSTLFGAWDDVGDATSESAYICMFSNLPPHRQDRAFLSCLPGSERHREIFRFGSPFLSCLPGSEPGR